MQVDRSDSINSSKKEQPFCLQTNRSRRTHDLLNKEQRSKTIDKKTSKQTKQSSIDERNFYKHAIENKYQGDKVSQIQDIMLTLKKQKSQRNKFDIYLILQLLENIYFFKNMVEEGKEYILYQCCRIISAQYYKKDEVVIKQYDRADTFYILISGKCSVYVAQPKDEKVQLFSKEFKFKKNIKTLEDVALKQEKLEKRIKQQEKQYETQILGEFLQESLLISENLSQNPLQFNKKASPCPAPLKAVFISKSLKTCKKQEGVIHMKQKEQVATLLPGQSFGELGIIEGTTRSATVIANTSALILKISALDYSNILKMDEKQKMDKELENIKKFSILQNLEEKTLKSISYYFSKITVTMNTIIYSPNEPSSFVYFINSGDFLLSSPVLPDAPQKTVNPFQILPQTRLHQTKVNLLSLSSGTIFGDDEVILKQTRNYQVSCQSASGQLYRLSAETYIKKLYEPLFLNSHANPTNIFQTKNNFLRNEQTLLNAVKQQNLPPPEPLHQARDHYFLQQAQEVADCITKASSKSTQEDRVSKTLIKKYSLQMYEPCREQKFHHISNHLAAQESQFSQALFQPSTHAEYLQRVGKIYSINKMKAINQANAKILSHEQMMMGNLGLGLQSCKSSKHRYFKGQGMPQGEQSVRAKSQERTRTNWQMGHSSRFRIGQSACQSQQQFFTPVVVNDVSQSSTITKQFFNKQVKIRKYQTKSNLYSGLNNLQLKFDDDDVRKKAKENQQILLQTIQSKKMQLLCQYSNNPPSKLSRMKSVKSQSSLNTKGNYFQKYQTAYDIKSRQKLFELQKINVDNRNDKVIHPLQDDNHNNDNDDLDNDSIPDKEISSQSQSQQQDQFEEQEQEQEKEYEQKQVEEQEQEQEQDEKEQEQEQESVNKITDFNQYQQESQQAQPIISQIETYKLQLIPHSRPPSEHLSKN